MLSPSNVKLSNKSFVRAHYMNHDVTLNSFIPKLAQACIIVSLTIKQFISFLSMFSCYKLKILFI